MNKAEIKLRDSLLDEFTSYCEESGVNLEIGEHALLPSHLSMMAAQRLEEYSLERVIEELERLLENASGGGSWRRVGLMRLSTIEKELEGLGKVK